MDPLTLGVWDEGLEQRRVIPSGGVSRTKEYSWDTI